MILDLPGEAFLPDDYVSDRRLKIDLYRRLARIASYAELSELNAELVDRFGALPNSAQRMLALHELRLDAATWQIRGIKVEDRYLVFSFADRRRIEQLAKMCRGRLRIVDDHAAYVTLAKNVEQPDAIMQAAKSVLSVASS